ncbi:hypothetical protein QZH41_016187 [Actinostola sp. cb2023]|nr:hypothetical protein QZH41_016187 [Actinostola sp. cb2023]
MAGLSNSKHGDQNDEKLADMDLKMPPRYSALYEAAEKGDIQEITRLLASKMVNVNGRSGEHGALRTALHGAAGYGHWRATRTLLTVECLRLLIGYGSDMGIEDKDGCNVAHLAALRNHPDIIRCLFEEDVDLNCRDKHKRVPAHYAAMCGGQEALKVLAHNDLEAAINGATECLHWLLEHRANPCVQDGSANSPLHYAAKGGHAQCISCLLHHKADMDAQTPQRLCPLDFAKKAGKTVPFEKAVSNEIRCSFCVAKQQQIEYDFAHQPTQVERSITESESVIFNSPKKLEKEESSPSKSTRPRSSKTKPNTCTTTRPKSKTTLTRGTAELPKRDLASKYFGEYLFSLPEVLKSTSRGSSRH